MPLNHLEKQVANLAKLAACKRYALEFWNTRLVIKRLEVTGPGEWEAYYDEPDTLTKESMTVTKVGDSLLAQYTDEPPLKIAIMDEPEEQENAG